MIVKSKAIEPKSASANSTYYAVIIRVIPTYNDLTVNLQVYCPDVMSGTPNDALASLSNILEAPVKPHNGENVEDYDYKVGGIVIISYQNGNVNSPQFVRYVEIDDKIVEINKAYIDGVRITYDSNIFSVSDISNLDMSTVGLQKGVALLPALKKFAPPNGIFHTYGYDKKGPTSELNGKQYLTIYKCGAFGTEFVLRKANSFKNVLPEEANFDYFSTEADNDNNPRNLINSFISSSIDSDSKIIDAVNKAIKNFTKTDKTIYSKASLADALFWYTKLAGYIYDDNAESNIIQSEWFSRIKLNNITRTQLKRTNNEKIASVIYQGIGSNDRISLYRGTFRTDGSSTETINNTFGFVKELWSVLSNDSYFQERMSVFYSCLLVNNLISMKNTYNVKSLTNKSLIICAVIATAFPVLTPVIKNFELADKLKGYYTDNKRIKNFVQNMIDGMTNNESIKYSTDTLAGYFTDLYFQVLNWPMTSSGIKLFEYSEKPDNEIKSMMKTGIDYIMKHYNDLSSVLDDGEEGDKDIEYIETSGFIWPVPSCKTISSYFGHRNTGIAGASTYHEGIDIACPNGSKVVAAKEGKITKAGTYGGYGVCVIIKHDNGFETRYGHLMNATVSVGDKVARGQKIANSDNSGISSGAHCHFEIRKNGTAVNPLNYVKK